MASKPTYEELEKIIESQNKFAERFPDLICIFTENGFFKYLNKTWEKTLGYSLDELMSKPILDFIHPDDVETTVESARKYLSGDQLAKNDNRYRCKNGSYKHFEWHTSPAYDGQFYAVGRDVTERKQAEEKLRRVEKRLRLALASGYAIAFEWDIERDEVYRFTSDYSELPTKANQPQAFSEFTKIIDPEDRETAVSGLRSAIENGADRYDNEFRILLPDGTRRWVQEYGYFERDDQDRPIRLIGLSQDITERKQVEEELRESEQRFRALVEASSESLYIMNPDWTEMRQLYSLGFLSETLEPNRKWLKEYIHPDDKEYVIEVINDAVRNKRTFQLEHRVWRADGSLGWTISRAVPLFNKEGEIKEWFGAATDIAERKQAEQALTKAHNELESRVVERTEELEKRAAQLARLSSELVLAEQRERDRIAEVLHDHLQQLIVGAKIGQEMLISDLDDITRPKADRVLDLITQSLRTSRSLSTELSPNVLRTGNLTDALKWLARWMLETHGLEVQLKINQKILLKRKDIIILLFQSIRELLLNTLKHSGAKSATVSAKFVNRELLIMVSDEGRGFDPKRVQKKKYSSSQFGLFSIEERLQHLGGKLDVESSPNAGTDISIAVPIRDKISSTKEQLPLFSRVEKRKVDKVTKPEKISILLVDDHQVMREGLANLLGLHSDIEVLGQASDGEEAVNLARELLPDVILMDVNMPKMDGVEATRVLSSEFPHIRIIGLSMYDEDEKAAEMIEAGASAYRSKSGNTDLLLASIRGE